MKKIYSLSMLLLAGVFGLTSCSDDNESNPTLTQPTEFVLNQPAITGTVDLNNSTSIGLSWSQPRSYNNFDAPVVPTYTVQISPSASFNKEFDANLEDNSGADFISLEETYSSGNGVEIVTATLNRALMQLEAWEENTVPSVLDLAIRVKSAIRDASFNEYGIIYSNIVSLKTAPYYIELKPAEPEIWWLIGSDICDGSWGGDYGKCVIPMQTINGAEYDKKTGQGEIQWIGYLGGNGFKLRGSMEDNWATQWGQGDAFGQYKKNDGGSGNITVPEAGIYTVSLNTATDELKVEKYEDTPQVFSGMAIAGSFNDWGDTDMTPCSTGWENHDWYITHDFNAGDEIKIKQAGTWDYNKGGSFANTGDNLFVYGVDGGSNLVIPETGKYIIFFNDITGYIRFMKQ